MSTTSTVTQGDALVSDKSSPGSVKHEEEEVIWAPAMTPKESPHVATKVPTDGEPSSPVVYLGVIPEVPSNLERLAVEKVVLSNFVLAFVEIKKELATKFGEEEEEEAPTVNSPKI